MRLRQRALDWFGNLGSFLVHAKSKCAAPNVAPVAPVENPTPKGTRAVPAKPLPQRPVETGSAIAKNADEDAELKFGTLLKNTKGLIKAEIYPAARRNLHRIIDEAPGTKVADEAKKLLDSIPK